MPLQNSGPISLNDIHQEIGGASGTSVSLNDADVRGLIGVGSGATNSMSAYYGASSYVFEGPRVKVGTLFGLELAASWPASTGAGWFFQSGVASTSGTIMFQNGVYFRENNSTASRNLYRKAIGDFNHYNSGVPSWMWSLDITLGDTGGTTFINVSPSYIPASIPYSSSSTGVVQAPPISTASEPANPGWNTAICTVEGANSGAIRTFTLTRGVHLIYAVAFNWRPIYQFMTPNRDAFSLSQSYTTGSGNFVTGEHIYTQLKLK